LNDFDMSLRKSGGFIKLYKIWVLSLK
jgi:hypothetical protein